MHIGLDFDNTIVCYDELFHRVALEGGWIKAEVPRSKLSVRNHFREINKEKVWTELQGYVYGARMDEAAIYPGVMECLTWASRNGIQVSIVSHKTKNPFLGKQYDLHDAASNWITKYLNDGSGPLVEQDSIFFEPTKEAKIKRINELACSVYVDDLPEILLNEEFPTNVKKLLFDPDNHYDDQSLPRALHWNEVRTSLEHQWQQTA